MAGQASGELVGFLAGCVWKPLYTGLWVAVGLSWCSGYRASCANACRGETHDALQEKDS